MQLFPKPSRHDKTTLSWQGSGTASEYVHGGGGHASSQVLIDFGLEHLPGASRAVKSDEDAKGTLRELSLADVQVLVGHKGVVYLVDVYTVKLYVQGFRVERDRLLPLRHPVEVLGDHSIQSVVDVVLGDAVLGQGEGADKDRAGGTSKAVLVLWQLGKAVKGQEKDEMSLELKLAVYLSVELVLDGELLLFLLSHIDREGDVESVASGQDLSVDIKPLSTDGNNDRFPVDRVSLAGNSRGLWLRLDGGCGRDNTDNKRVSEKYF
ncbi:hypothetical protein PG994_005533 [Apiospora phragmitis]|uniref:Uncharacterized protein n=1 Tax=Apiospora phragmitis TaxID=2905665 RepID=A0ABR1VDI6_9PEZI